MVASDSRSFDQNVSKKSPLSTGVCLAVALVFGAICFVLLFRDNAAAKLQPAQPGNQAPGAANPKEAELKREDLLALEEQRARAQARLEAIRFVQREANGMLDKLEQDVIVWETRLPELLKGNDGKRIAASKIRAEQFASVIESDRITRQRAQALREQLDILSRHLDRAIFDGTSYFASDSFVNDIEKFLPKEK